MLTRRGSAHQSLSGFSKHDLETITNGKCPESFSVKQKIAYRVASELGKFGPLPQEVFDESVKVSMLGLPYSPRTALSSGLHIVTEGGTNLPAQILGVSGTTSLIHYCGFYSYIATILNGFDAQNPEGH